MSMPNIPDVDATINITLEDSVNLLLASVAFEELGLAHIINAEAEKIQFILGTLEGQTPPETPPTIDELLEINRSVERTLRNVLKSQMLLQFKLEDTISITPAVTTENEPA
jgi:Trk K+ transport system NAD-binding subunit